MQHFRSISTPFSRNNSQYFTQNSETGADLQLRENIAEEWKWDLTTIFPDNEAWEDAFQAVEGSIGQSTTYQGRLAQSGDILLAALQQSEEISQQVGKLYVYAHLKHDENTADNDNAARQTRIEGLYAELSGAWAWLTPELSELTEEQIQSFMEEEPGLHLYQRFFEKIQRNKRHVLSDKEETLLAKAGQIFDTNSNVFSILTDADFVFPKVKDGNDEVVQITHGRYGKLMEDRNREVRKNTFESYYSVFEQYRNTLATTLRGEVQIHNYLSQIRGFSSARERALFNNEIPESVYDNLVASVNDNLPLLHQYVELRRDRLDLPDFHSYDLYVPMAADIKMKFTYEAARDLVLEALRPMGDEYINLIHRAFGERWIDVYENKGKTSGGYSSGTYGTNPFILLNWRETLDMVYTLIHELGHSVHSWYSRTTQPYIYAGYPIFLAEIASTTNENLLTHYLLQHETNQEMRDYVIGHYLDGFKGTVFRQTQFAEFEQQIHLADQEGIALTADYLSEEYGKLNQRYYGPTLEQDPAIRLEWSRIPHFYYNFYVYQYATGFSAATTFSETILQEGRPAVERYIDFLKAGSSAPPIEVLQKAGLDMTSPEPVNYALQVFGRYLEEARKKV